MHQSHVTRAAIATLTCLAVGIGCSSDTKPVVATTTLTSTTSPDTATSSTSLTTVPLTTSSSAPAPTPTVPDSKPDSASELAKAILEAEDAVRTIREPSLRAQWGERQQWLYLLMDADPERAGKVLEMTDDSAVALNYRARVALTALVNSHAISGDLPAWSIEPPLPPEELLALYQAGENATGIDWEYLAAINLVETRMGRIRGVSTAGAVGPMQFLPSTWAECCEGDPTVAADAILGAGQYLVDRGGPDNMDKAILGYNNSRHYVDAIQAYAEVLRIDPDAYFGYHAWQVYFRTTAGLARLKVGYFQDQPVDALAWVTENPDDLVD